MKHMVFMRSGAAFGDLQGRALRAGERAPFDVAINLPQGEAPWHVVIEAWIDDGTLREFLAAELPSQRGEARAVCNVEEIVEKDEGPGPGWPVAGVRLLVPWIRRSDVSPAQCRRHWDEHVPLANRIHVGVTRYVRNWVVGIETHGAAAAPYQGIASQHYASMQDLQERSFDQPASVQVINDDVAEFLVDPLVLLVTEYRRSGRR